jgi:hypothetical protein
MTKENKYGLLAILLAGIILFIFFGKVLTHPNSSMLSISGDGLKNYFSVLYYLQNDNGAHFTGMNYPFGEHISFADGMPGLLIPIKYVATVFPSLKNMCYAIINLLCILNYLFCVFFLYKILMHFKTNIFFSILGALLINYFESKRILHYQSHAFSHSYGLAI